MRDLQCRAMTCSRVRHFMFDFVGSMWDAFLDRCEVRDSHQIASIETNSVGAKKGVTCRHTRKLQ